MRSATIFIILSFLLAVPVLGQVQVEGRCAQNLELANTEFDLGHFYKVAPILQECINRGFTREQKIQAFYLLTRTYLFLDKLDSADYAYLELLKLDPEYTVSEETDPIDIVYLSQNFRTTPIFSLKLFGGANYSDAAVVRNWGVDNTDASLEKYKKGWGFQLGAGVELHFSNSFSLDFTPQASLKQTRYENTLWDGDILTKREAGIFLDMPLKFRYTLNTRNIRPYIFAGGTINLLFVSTSPTEFRNFTDEAVTPSEGPSVNNTATRSFINRSLVFGAGVMYKVNYNYVWMELSYWPGMNLFNNPDTRFVVDGIQYNLDFPWLYPYIDDDFRLNSGFINIGFTRPLYRPRKKSSFTIRELFGKGDEQ